MGYHLGVVGYLNARPLIAGLDDDIHLTLDVPARLPALLEAGEVDAALVPIVDLARPGRDWKIVSDACIGCDGETMTVRVFSRVPPEEVRTVYVDGDSHTSVVLASLFWQETYGTNLALRPLTSAVALGQCESVLLIGDKVVARTLDEFAHQIDMGGAWRTLTGLPFVFAAWVARADRASGDLAATLSAARDRGIRQLEVIATRDGPKLGWPVELAREYLRHHLDFTMTARHREGMELFFDMAARCGILPQRTEPVFA